MPLNSKYDEAEAIMEARFKEYKRRMKKMKMWRHVQVVSGFFCVLLLVALVFVSCAGIVGGISSGIRDCGGVASCLGEFVRDFDKARDGE